MYVVVVCPKCKDNAWIVDGRPDTTQCGKCGHSRQFKRYKHIHETGDKEEARLVLAQTRATMNNLEDEFQQAYESGALTGEIEGTIASDLSSELLSDELQDELKEIDDRTTKSEQSRSELEIIKDGVREQSSPSREDVIEYAAEYGVAEEKTKRVLHRLQRDGEVLESNGELTFL